MASVTVRFESGEKVSVIESDDGWGFCDPYAEVTFDNDSWWLAIEALQDWLGECRHCGKPVASRPSPEDPSPPKDPAPNHLTGGE